MPYLKPEDALERLSGFTRDEIRTGIADDREFLKDQAGSMSSTLRFLAQEIEMREAVVEEQHETLLSSLDAVERMLGEVDTEGGATVQASVTDARARIESVDTFNVYALEQELLTACNEVLDAIEAELDGQAARCVRRPLYDYIDTRLRLQLEILGRSSD